MSAPHGRPTYERRRGEIKLVRQRYGGNRGAMTQHPEILKSGAHSEHVAKAPAGEK